MSFDPSGIPIRPPDDLAESDSGAEPVEPLLIEHGPPAELSNAGDSARHSLLPWILFGLTGLSTFIVAAIGGAGTLFVGDLPRPVTDMLVDGMAYSMCVMAILLAHELGHYLQARRYGVPASLPLFIPMPLSPFGTMGAVILQRAGVADRKQLFDIAISGPLTGLCVALPVAWWGLHYSRIIALPPVVVPNQMIYGDPLLLRWMAQSVLGPVGPGEDYLLNPILFAGWVGLFITGLNLIPIGQLDGGHLLYTLLGPRANGVMRLIFRFAVAAVVVGSFFDASYTGWFVMLLLLWWMGTRHPPTASDGASLGWRRVVLGWATLALIFVLFTPTPIVDRGPKDKAQDAAPVEKLAEKPADNHQP